MADEHKSIQQSIKCQIYLLLSKGIGMCMKMEKVDWSFDVLRQLSQKLQS